MGEGLRKADLATRAYMFAINLAQLHEQRNISTTHNKIEKMVHNVFQRLEKNFKLTTDQNVVFLLILAR